MKLNKYCVDKRKIIGKGSFSVVYSGKNTDTGERVAIKKVKRGDMINDELIEREIKFVRMMIDRNNPYENFVRYYDIIMEDDSLYIVMEYCECGSLSSLLIKPMNEKYMKYYFTQILNALYDLDSLGIIHGDIKPDNILLTNDFMKIKFCDFGFAHHNKDQDQDMICGTLKYMSPIDTNSDLWGAGVILYEMTFGYCPNEINLNEIYLNKICPDNDIRSLLKRILDINMIREISIRDIISEGWMNDSRNIKCVNIEEIYIDDNKNKIVKVVKTTNKTLNDKIMNNGAFDNIIMNNKLYVRECDEIKYN